MVVDLCELKEISHLTVELIWKWRNQDHIRKMMFNSEKISLVEHYKWIDSLKCSNNVVKIFYFKNIPYGVVNFKPLNDSNIWEWGFYIGDEDSPKGMGTLLGYNAINYFFSKIKGKKIFAEVLGYNQISINFHQKLGFKCEGKLKKNIIKNGEEIDVILFGLFEEDWKETKSKVWSEIEEKFNGEI